MITQEDEHAIDAQVTGFAAYLPLPYRVPVIVALGIFLFGTNLTLLIRAKIDVEGLFYPSSVSSQTSSSRRQGNLSRPVYAVAMVSMAIAIGEIICFWTVSDGESNTMDYRVLPILAFLAFSAVLFSPVRFYAIERYRFLQVLKRIMLGGIDVTDRFLDVIVADIMTSYAKVFGDIVMTVCIIFGSSDLPYQARRMQCAQSSLVPLAIAAPYAVRLRQCLIEYRRTGGRAHLANAAKYCTAFPVILISTIQLGRAGGEAGTPDTAYISNEKLYTAWVLACLVNTGYSFWWDVTKDWDLGMLSKAGSYDKIDSHEGTLSLQTGPQKHARLLRKNLSFSPKVYYVAIFSDLVLRMLWSVKLSPHLHSLAEYESGVFLMECLEVTRRWMWIFLRVECEHHRVHSHEGSIALTELGGVAFTSGPVGKFDQD